MFAPLLILIVWMGMYSSHFLRPMDASVAKVIRQMETQGAKFAQFPTQKPQ